jgi:hypothetical protein
MWVGTGETSGQALPITRHNAVYQIPCVPLWEHSREYAVIRPKPFCRQFPPSGLGHRGPLLGIVMK